MSYLKNESLKGAWPIYSSLIISKGINLISRFVLARFFLGPSDFGQFAVILVFVELMLILGEAGQKKAIVVVEEHESKILKISFTFLLIYNLLLCLVATLLAPFVSMLFNIPNGHFYMWLLTPFVFILNMSAVPAGYLNKQKRFKYQIVSFSASSLSFLSVALFMASMGKGVYSLVLAQSVSMGIQGLTVFLCARIKYGFLADKKIFGELFSTGLSSLLIAFQAYLDRHYDNFIIAIFCSNYVLGSYFMAYTIISILMFVVRAPLSEYVFSSLAKYKKDRVKVKKYLLLSRSWDICVIFPALGGLFIFADDLVVYILGNKWSDSIYYLRLLIPYAYVWSIGHGLNPQLILGNRKIANRVILIKSLLTLIIIPILANIYGIDGVVIAITIVGLIITIYGNFFLFKELKILFKEFLWVLRFGLMSLFFGILFYKAADKQYCAEESFERFLFLCSIYCFPTVMIILYRVFWVKDLELK